ncbi:hypothetical protein LQW54_005465 [Pestalotiopsis sp. IQ-011]
MTADSEITDVIIIGGSHAGLSAALTLYRACHTSLIFDAGAPRNAKADHVHMTPGFDNKTPNELREVARDELRATGLAQFVPQKVVTATKTPDGLFEVVDGAGKHWKGRKILLALGVQEKYPDIEGYAENYGRHIYHCLFCFGYEDQGCSMAAVLADGPLADVAMSTIYASNAKKFAKTDKIYTHGNIALADAISEKLPQGVEVDHRRLTWITERSGGGIAVEFAEGPGDQLAFMAHSPEMPVDRTLPDQLGCECDKKTGIKVNPPFYSTTAPGVFAAGDCCAPLKSILMGMTAGSCAGVGIARELPARGA